jgi:hypothetical protein
MARKPKFDHTTITEKPPAKEKVRDKDWWLLDVDEMPGAIQAVVQTIKERQARLEAQRLTSAKLYGNVALMGVQGSSVSRASAAVPGSRDRITYNVVASCVDTVGAKMAKNKPKPLFLTSGADFKLQRKAKKLTKFVEGVFFENQVRKMAPRTFKEGAVLGDGLIHVFEQHDRVRYERVMASEVYVDEIEGLYGRPRQLHRAKNVDRRVLVNLAQGGGAWEKDAVQAIKDASEAGAMESLSAASQETIGDQVSVIESWHLRSGPDEKDGRHVLSIEGAVLAQEDWPHDFFPFARFPWSAPIWGYWSKGLAESIQNIQLEINKLLWLIQRSMHLMGTWKVALEYGSKIASTNINNDIGTIIWFNKAQPVYLTPQVVPAEYYAHFERLKAAAYDQAGISQLSATSEKPAGLNSGAALREYGDIESDRFQVVGQSYEELHMDLARMTVATARRIYDRTGELSVDVPGRSFIETIDWGEVSLEDDQFVLQMFPVSSLPSDPAGRLQTVTEYVQAGFIDPMTAQRLLDFPDLEQYDSLRQAVEDRIMSDLESIIDKGVYEPPDPYLDLKMARMYAVQFYNRAAVQKVPGPRLEMIRTYCAQLDVLMQKAMPSVPMVPPNGVPTGAPAAPPTAELLPTAPAPSIPS